MVLAQIEQDTNHERPVHTKMREGMMTWTWREMLANVEAEHIGQVFARLPDQGRRSNILILVAAGSFSHDKYMSCRNGDIKFSLNREDAYCVLYTSMP